VSAPLLRIGRLMVSAIVALVALYAAVLALVWWQQERLIFLPSKLAPDHRFEFGADVHEVWIEVPGARLHALHLRNAQPRGVVFFLHGNAGNLESWFADADFYRQLDLDLFMLDYRGYGKSSGRVHSQVQLEADVRAAWARIAPRYAGSKRVFIGQSLGSALAAGLAAEVQPELTVLVSPYESMAALAAEHYRWVPQALLRYPLRTDVALSRVKSPVLLLHGDRDDLIAPHHSEQLLRVAPQAEHVVIRGAGHNDVERSPQYLEVLAARLR
jgi:alpha-beta hydrolase superfamily lysophospholipase